MQISYRKSFKKAFEKLSQNIKKQAIERIDLFTNNPTHPILNNHKLQGTYL